MALRARRCCTQPDPLQRCGGHCLSHARSPRAVLAAPALAKGDMPDADYPLVLNTGRVQHQWHTRTKTGAVPALNKLNPGPFVEVHPQDAAALGLADGGRAQLRTRRGRPACPWW
jgi:anaerobic selenocysteine-containing dehydrogenase